MAMTKGMVVACAAVGVLGLITVILGIAGAASGTCKYNASPAVGFGFVAALLALTTQIVATAATGCCGCCRTWGIPNEAKRIVAVVLSTFSWVLALIVVIVFIAAAIVSIAGDLGDSDGGNCVPPGTGAFIAATVMFIIALVCQITSYILLQATTVAAPTKSSTLAQESGIAMGQPAAAEPVNGAEQKAAVAGDLPPSAPPAASSEATVNPPPSAPPAASSEGNVEPPPSAPAMSTKASADPTSNV